MRPRYNATPSIHSRYSASRNMPQLQPRESKRVDRPSSNESHPSTESAIPTAELNGFALTCIERLAFPEKGNTSKAQSIEDTIASVVIDKLPSYTKAKATLAASEEAHFENHVWSSPLQTSIDQLRNRVEHMQDVIAKHLIQTGEEIGLPTPLLTKLADLTKTILTRYAE